MLSQKVSFRKAGPVWEKDKETVMNHSIVLRSVIGKDIYKEPPHSEKYSPAYYAHHSLTLSVQKQVK